MDLRVGCVGLISIEGLHALKDNALNGCILVHINHIRNIEKLRRIVIDVLNVDRNGEVAALWA